MSLFKRPLLSGLLLLTLSAAQAGANCPGNVASLPLRLVQSIVIVVSVEVNGAGPYDFMVDTGAQVSTIDTSLAAELHVKPQSSVGLSGAATYVRSAFAYLARVQAGDRVVTNSPAVILDIGQLGLDRHIRGILGGSFLEHFDLLIDYRHRLLCLDDTGALAPTVKGERIPLAEPRGTQSDLPFTRPILISARLSTVTTPVLLRLDSGSNVAVLYAADALLHRATLKQLRQLKRKTYGLEQDFGLLPPQELWVGRSNLKRISFAIPMNLIGKGVPTPREDGLLPTMAYDWVFISCKGGYVVLRS